MAPTDCVLSSVRVPRAISSPTQPSLSVQDVMDNLRLVDVGPLFADTYEDAHVDPHAERKTERAKYTNGRDPAGRYRRRHLRHNSVLLYSA